MSSNKNSQNACTAPNTDQINGLDNPSSLHPRKFSISAHYKQKKNIILDKLTFVSQLACLGLEWILVEH